MPWMRLRVVCGLRVTIASFSPTRAFSSVDLPALGRPMMETKPERNGIYDYYAATEASLGRGVSTAYGIVLVLGLRLTRLTGSLRPRWQLNVTEAKLLRSDLLGLQADTDAIDAAFG